MSAFARPPEERAPSLGEAVAQRQEGRPYSAFARPPEERAPSLGEAVAQRQEGRPYSAFARPSEERAPSLGEAVAQRQEGRLSGVALIMAGGTGGHIMPGLAVAAVLRERGWRVLWLGNPDKMEGRLVPAQGIEMAELRFQGLRGRGVSALLQLPGRLFAATRQAWRHLSAERPDVVLGMGGYVAFPGGLAAALRRVPVVVHEQNAVAGTANRTLARLARRVLTGFPDVLPRGEMVGNPVRHELCAVAAPEQRYASRAGALNVLVVGGSLGAQALNTVVPQALALLPENARPRVTHQAGEQHIDTLRAAYAAAGVRADCRAFIEDMAGALAAADVVICRAGAMTVAEIAAVGVAALFVPFPHAIDDHQTANARYLSETGAAWLRQQTELTPQWLADWLTQRGRDELQAVAARARARAMPDAARHIADACEAVAVRRVGGRVKQAS